MMDLQRTFDAIIVPLSGAPAAPVGGSVPLNGFRWGLLVLLLALFVAAGILVSRLYRRLETLHPEVWQELGSPAVFWNISPRIQQAVGRFLDEGRYARLKDPEVIRLAQWLLWLRGVAVVVFMVFAAAVMVPWLWE